MKDIIIYTWLTAAAASGGSSPFWMGANQYGLFPEGQFSTVALVGAKLPYNEENTIQWHAGAAVAGNLSSQSDIFADECYAGLRWKKISLDAGLWRQPQRYLADRPSLGSLSLTGGNFIMSGNARPMPGYSLDIAPFAVPGTRKIVWLFGRYGDYRTIDARFAKNALVHNTLIGGRIDIGERLKLTGSLELWSQWGGDSGYKLGDVNLKNYLKIITFSSGGDDSSAGAQESRLGNHIGLKSFQLSYRFDSWTLNLQQDSPFEDKSGLYFQNFPDGNWTVHVQRHNRRDWITDALVEFQYTRSQSGEAHDRPATPEEKAAQDPSDPYYGKIVLGGDDNYFNHEDYRSGWTHYGRVIGTPLFLFDPSLIMTGSYAVGNCPVWNNRLVALHAASSGYLLKDERYPYKLMLTGTRNWGTYDHPFEPVNQIYTGFTGEVDGVLRFARITYGLFADFGDVSGNHIGAQVGLRFSFFKK